jgi:hypothetical protein
MSRNSRKPQGAKPTPEAIIVTLKDMVKGLTPGQRDQFINLADGAFTGEGFCIVSAAKLRALTDRLNEMKRWHQPRNEKRDDLIVRLRDEKGLSFGQIASHLTFDLPGQNLLVGRQTVKKAYHRRKARLGLQSGDK